MKYATAFGRSMGIAIFLLLLALFSYSQNNFKVTGKVNDETGKPVESATVTVKGTSNATVTRADGSFDISAPSENATLVISHVNYGSIDFPLKGQSNVTIAVTSTLSSLEDVVVIGYATVKKKDVTGAVAGINQKDIRSRPVNNVLEAMQGKVAGVDIRSNERPGTVPAITIRGVRSLSASNSPLYVVDGIPLISGGIDNINPEDIETIDVLKDASATAIYGSRGANGVIIVTTKQGKNGKVTLGLNHSVTLETLEDRQDMMDASEYITFRRWAYYYAGLNPATGISTYPRGDQPDQAKDRTFFAATTDPFAWANIAQGWAGGTWDGSKVQTTDWGGMVKQQSLTSNNTISVSGGTDRIKAYGSFGYLNNKGTIIGQNFTRYSSRVNIDFKATNWLSFGTNISIAYNKQNYGQSNAGVATIGSPSGGLYGSARSIFPYAVPYDSAGNRILFPGGDNAVKNIVGEEKYNIDRRETLRAFGSLYAQIDAGSIISALKGLKYRVNFGPDFSYYRQGVYIDANSVANGGSTSYASLNNDRRFSYTLDHLLYYDRSIGDHTFGLTLLASQTAFNIETSGITGNGVPQSSQLWNALTSGTVTGTLTSKSNLIEQQLRSFMARINYSFKEKYLLTVSAREDGASQLAAGHKYSLFPSAALAWRISKENFMNAPWLNDLKLRVGAGVTGNSAIDPYATQGAIQSLFYPFIAANTAGAIPSNTLANQELGWEKTTQYNLGLDFQLFKGRLGGSVDVYTSTTDDLLLKRQIPTVTGYPTTFANIGKTANKGIDINLTTVNIRKKDLTWTTTLNAAWQKEHIVSLSNGKQDQINDTLFIGQPVGVIYGYKSLGLWQTKDAAEMAKFNANGNAFTAGSIRIEDINGDHKIDPNNDRQIIGWTRPRWVVGMTNTVNFKDFDFSIFLYGRLNYMNAYGGEVEAARSVNRKIDYYTENNPNAEFQKPIFNAGGAAGDPYYASLGYMKASFIKIRNISLGYNFSHKVLGGNWINSLRAYVQVTNPGMVYSKIDFLDMDLNSSTFNRGFTFGINASF